MQRWDPQLYARFEAERARPIADLLNRLPPGRNRVIVDLGCGNGVSTEALARRFPEAKIQGVDTSAPMLAAARTRLPELDFVEGDVAVWRNDEADLVFANALFQWVPGHIGIMARWAAAAPPGGVLAVQMPDNESEPTHRLMREIAAMAPFLDKLPGLGGIREPIGSFADYDEALSPFCDYIDIWRTVYAHRLASPEAIVAWVEGAGLRPYLQPLSSDERTLFLERYTERVASAYPTRGWGGVILPFPRIFIIARCRGAEHG